MNELFNHILYHDLTPNQMYILHCARKKIQNKLKSSSGEVLILITNGWLTPNKTLTPKAYAVLAETDKLFTKKAQEVSFSTLGPDADKRMEQFRQLFPPGSPANHGKPVRTAIHELESKFVWFFKTYPQYDWDMVMAATEFYIQDSKRKDNHFYLQVCKYFICKKMEDGSLRSDLATYCDDLQVPQQPVQQAA